MGKVMRQEQKLTQLKPVCKNREPLILHLSVSSPFPLDRINKRKPQTLIRALSASLFMCPVVKSDGTYIPDLYYYLAF